MFCKACGNEVLNTAVICPKCGSATDGETPGSPAAKSLITWGWVTAILFPIIGVILGIVITVKKNYGHGIGIIVTSLCSWIFWASFWVGFLSALN